MIYLITCVESCDEHDNTRFSVLEVSRDLVNRLKRYQKNTDRISEAQYIAFQEGCFYFSDDDFVQEFLSFFLPHLVNKVNNLVTGNYVISNEKVLNYENVHKTIELVPAVRHGIRLYPGGKTDPVFYAYNKYSNVEYSFQISIRYLEKIVDESQIITSEEKEKYLFSPNHCPKCNSENIESSGQVQVDSSGAWQDVECNACHFTWQDIYSLTNVIETHS